MSPKYSIVNERSGPFLSLLLFVGCPIEAISHQSRQPLIGNKYVATGYHLLAIYRRYRTRGFRLRILHANADQSPTTVRCRPWPLTLTHRSNPIYPSSALLHTTPTNVNYIKTYVSLIRYTYLYVIKYYQSLLLILHFLRQLFLYFILFNYK